VSMPAAFTNAALELGQLREQVALRGSWKMPTSVDNMDWSNPGLRTLYGLRIAPWVRANSIIPVLEEPHADGDDGVVRYASAHLDGVESELVVCPCAHSTQATPQTIEEARPLLHEQADIHCAAVWPISSSFFQVLSGSKLVMADAIFAVLGPRSFEYTTPS